MYEFKVKSKIKAYTESCVKYLIELNIPISKSVCFVECDGLTNAGWCRYAKKGEDCEFVIAINKNIVFIKDLRETIVHELLHTIEGCLNHNKKWKEYAALCSKTLKMEITIKGNILMHKNGLCVTEPDKFFVEESMQKEYINKLLRTNTSDLFKNINQICCYLSQENRDYLFLYLRQNNSKLFYDVSTRSIAKVVDSFASKKAKHKFAEEYLNGKYDYLNFSYEEWVMFSCVLALTRDYVRCEERFKNLNSRAKKMV